MLMLAVCGPFVALPVSNGNNVQAGVYAYAQQLMLSQRCSRLGERAHKRSNKIGVDLLKYETATTATACNEAFADSGNNRGRADKRRYRKNDPQ